MTFHRASPHYTNTKTKLLDGSNFNLLLRHGCIHGRLIRSDELEEGQQTAAAPLDGIAKGGHARNGIPGMLEHCTTRSSAADRGHQTPVNFEVGRGCDIADDMDSLLQVVGCNVTSLRIHTRCCDLTLLQRCHRLAEGVPDGVKSIQTRASKRDTLDMLSALILGIVPRLCQGHQGHALRNATRRRRNVLGIGNCGVLAEATGLWRLLPLSGRANAECIRQPRGGNSRCPERGRRRFLLRRACRCPMHRKQWRSVRMRLAILRRKVCAVAVAAVVAQGLPIVVVVAFVVEIAPP